MTQTINQKVDEHKLNTAKIAETYKAEENQKKILTDKKRDANYAIQKKIYALRSEQGKTDNKYLNEIRIIGVKFKAERKILSVPVKDLDKIIWFLKIDTKKKDGFRLDKVYGKNGESTLLEAYHSETSTLGLFLIPNNRDVNKFNLNVIGYTPFVNRDHGIVTYNLKGWTTDLKWDYDAADETQTRENINHDIKFFKREAEARKYAEKGIHKLFSIIMNQIVKLDKEYSKVIEEEKIEDYIDLILKQSIHYAANNVGWGSEEKDGRVTHLVEDMKPYMELTEQKANRLIQEELKN